MVNIESICDRFARKKKTFLMMCDKSQLEQRMLKSEDADFGIKLDFHSNRLSDKSTELPLGEKKKLAEYVSLFCFVLFYSFRV